MNFKDSESIVHVSLDNIIDPTLLRALGLIDNEEDVSTYFIDGRNVIPLMIKFKRQEKMTEVEVTKNYG